MATSYNGRQRHHFDYATMQSPSKYPGQSPRTAAPLKGLFKDGIWLCNCPQRLPAANRETKKPGANQGRRCKSPGWSTKEVVPDGLAD